MDYLMKGLRQLGPSFSSLDAKYVSSPCEKMMLQKLLLFLEFSSFRQSLCSPLS